MPFTPKPLCIAISQRRMHWTVAENLASIHTALQLAADAGATLCVFPELAVTGFHRQIASQAKSALVGPALQSIQQACAEHGIAAAVGAPSFEGIEGDAQIFNSHVLIEATGQRVATVAKIGLTAPEATFFQPGTERPVVQLQGRACTSVLCREIEDLAPVQQQLPPQTAELIFWPGLIGIAPEAMEAYGTTPVEDAQLMARATGAFIVQSNWPNALNHPETNSHIGQSAVVAPSGELLFRLPRAQAGIGIFTLGARQFEWLPEAAPAP
jgi:omega-amidase